MRRVILVAMILSVVGCQKAMSPELLKQYQSRTLYTCCNIFHESDQINDANYHVGQMVPLGSSAQVQDAARKGVTFLAGGTKLTLTQAYGQNEESFQQYIDKILVPLDPKAKLMSFPKDVQDAINDSRVEVGMSKEQVLMSIGYPPTHRTPSTTSNTWTYWWNRWVTYTVQFDDSGKVSGITGSNAPTRNQPIKAEPAPTPVTPAKAPAKAKKK